MNASIRGWVALCMTVAVALPMCAQAKDLSASEPFTTSQNTNAAQPPVNQAGNWQPDASTDLTRAQVYHDMVHAQQDGQVNYLDRTIYAHH
ncbi:DUF4148 domain-containing protein [Paraburkholderia humisilvae]|uniref:DUF4148 domain-containing protein n=1 Tax=Paraburkholderia humisilvae TaxID=627669 RepID=A0A6J5EJK2_9BURK|nr:DUF4148 domain-containing protein [Paraburkholderia humisilvae]CAB3765175.1 hypothetical protein LMG29542_05069 [Paraburkholderia humisilvae]